MTKARCAKCIEYELIIRAMKELLNEMPVKHPQQAMRREALNELVAESEASYTVRNLVLRLAIISP